MANRISLRICLAGLLLFALTGLGGCNSSDVNSQNSIPSGTNTGFGSSGGAAAQVTVTSASNPIANGATTTLTVIVADSQGRRTDASVILTSSGGGTFNGSATTFNANTAGGSLVVNFTASAAGSIEIVATVTGTSIRGSLTLTVV